jgi:hypothetical protein
VRARWRVCSRRSIRNPRVRVVVRLKSEHSVCLTGTGPQMNQNPQK